MTCNYIEENEMTEDLSLQDNLTSKYYDVSEVTKTLFRASFTIQIPYIALKYSKNSS